VSEGPQITIDPGKLSGAPCIDGHRIEAELVAQVVVHHGWQEARSMWELSRPQCIVCCWFVSEYRSRTKAGKHLADWSATNFKQIWGSEWDKVPDPPRLKP
jgi:hypothetical protein